MKRYSEPEDLASLPGGNSSTLFFGDQPSDHIPHFTTGLRGDDSLNDSAGKQMGVEEDTSYWNPAETTGRMPMELETPDAAGSSLWEALTRWPGEAAADCTDFQGYHNGGMLQQIAHSASLQLSEPSIRGPEVNVSSETGLDPADVGPSRAPSDIVLDSCSKDSNSKPVRVRRKPARRRLDFSPVTTALLDGRSYGPNTIFDNIKVVAVKPVTNVSSVDRSEDEDLIHFTLRRVRRGADLVLSCKGATCAGKSATSSPCRGSVRLAETRKGVKGGALLYERFTCFCEAHMDARDYRWTLNCTVCMEQKQDDKQTVIRRATQQRLGRDLKTTLARCAEHPGGKAGKIIRDRKRREARKTETQLSLARTSTQTQRTSPEPLSASREEQYIEHSTNSRR